VTELLRDEVRRRTVRIPTAPSLFAIHLVDARCGFRPPPVLRSLLRVARWAHPTTQLLLVDLGAVRHRYVAAPDVVVPRWSLVGRRGRPRRDHPGRFDRPAVGVDHVPDGTEVGKGLADRATLVLVARVGERPQEPFVLGSVGVDGRATSLLALGCDRPPSPEVRRMLASTQRHPRGPTRGCRPPPQGALAVGSKRAISAPQTKREVHVCLPLISTRPRPFVS